MQCIQIIHTPNLVMPVLDGLRHGEPVDGSPGSDVNNSRKKIVVVGLGMVAISFM